MASKNTDDIRPKKDGVAATSPTESKGISRRQFLKGAGITGLGAVSLYLLGCAKAPLAAGTSRQILVPNSNLMILGDPTKCVGCRRCEIACVSFNEGRVQPALARVKVYRNYNYGPDGVATGFGRSEGLWGNHRFVQETCRQCPHPVPCLDACPSGAIEIDPKTNARVVNTLKCTGCKTCQRACPWAMTTFDTVTQKASKCHLCGGDPECVKACPTGALQVVAWVDKTKNVPPRFVTSVDIPDDVKAACLECHPAGK